MEQKNEQKLEGVGKKHEKEKEKHESLVRILSTDISGEKNLFVGLTRIKGVSFAISNAICYNLNMDKRKKIINLSKEEIEKISNEIKKIKIPIYMMNRRKDFDTGIDKHLSTTELDLQKEFDIKRHKKIKSYKGKIGRAHV